MGSFIDSIGISRDKLIAQVTHFIHTVNNIHKYIFKAADRICKTQILSNITIKANAIVHRGRSIFLGSAFSENRGIQALLNYSAKNNANTVCLNLNPGRKQITKNYKRIHIVLVQCVDNEYC